VSARALAALGALLLVGCLSDPLGPSGGVVITAADFRSDSVLAGAPGRALGAPIQLRALDAQGHPVAGAEVHWTVSGDGASVSGTTAWTDAEGRLSAVWTLGVRATQAQQLTAEVRAGRHRAALTLTAAAIPSQVAVVSLARDTIVVRLGATAEPQVVAADSFGNAFVAQGVTLQTLDSSVAVVTRDGAIAGVRRGWTHLVADAVPTRDTGLVKVVQIVDSLSVGADSLVFTSLGQSESLRVSVWDDRGQVVNDTQPILAILDTAVGTLTATTPLTVRSTANGRTVVHLQVGDVSRDVPVRVSQQSARVQAISDTVLLDALQAEAPLEVQVLDALGNPIGGATLQYRVEDTSVASVSSAGVARALANGMTWVTASAGAESTSVLVRVNQRPTRLEVGTDTLRFDALGLVEEVNATAFDSLGSPLATPAVVTATSDTSVARPDGSGGARSAGNGVAVATFAVAGLTAQVPVVVAQVATTIAVQAPPVLGAPQDSELPLACPVLDRNGQPLNVTAVVAPSAGGHWVGQSCGHLRLQASGFDTLHVSANGLSVSVPVALAVRPIVSSPAGQYLTIDSLPSNLLPWAPTLWRAPSGEFQLYFAGYERDTTSPSGFRGHLHRAISADGQHYRYDGVVLQRDDSNCALNGSGIENIAIAPRSDGAGWRMFYSSGSFGCYGWQVFSAVSPDGATWTKEPGVRIGNGGSVPPAAPVDAPWPVGEGMVVEQLASGEWRMLVGGYRQVIPVEDKFQIVEWRSVDQMTWQYGGPVLTTDDLPATGRRSVYSPAIREFSPGLWRMLFTADNLHDPGGRSRMWSAVSVDKVHWQVEGEIMGQVGSDLYYATLIDDQVVFIRKEVAQYQRLATATISMP
jgi:hypothetical protein